MKPFSILIIFLFSLININAQTEKMDDTKLPYYEIPAAPKTYTAATVMARTIDGLGYRYFWATKDLRKEDLDYKLSETSRTTRQTAEHVYNLSATILKAISTKPRVLGGTGEEKEKTFAELRLATLENFKAASDLLRVPNANVEDMKIVFQRGEKKSEYPFWNLINGPIEDALWHAGQIVASRRASGNPLPVGVNVFMGKTRN